MLWSKVPQALERTNPGGVLPAAVVTGVNRANGGSRLSYRGKEGKTALDLLEQVARVETVRHSPLQVTSIDGRAASQRQHWVYLVDGFVQSAAPDEYVTRAGQTITWTLQDAR